MTYQIQFHTCKDKIAALNPPLGEESNRFATLADRLFLGKDMLVDIPSAGPDEHIDQILLVNNGRVVVSVYLMCLCTARVTEERATSDLMVPEKRILIPK